MELNDKQKRFLLAAFESQSGTDFNIPTVAALLGWSEHEGEDTARRLAQAGHINPEALDWNTQLSQQGREIVASLISSGEARRWELWTEPQAAFVAKAMRISGGRNRPINLKSISSSGIVVPLNLRRDLENRGVLAKAKGELEIIMKFSHAGFMEAKRYCDAIDAQAAKQPIKEEDTLDAKEAAATTSIYKLIIAFYEMPYSALGHVNFREAATKAGMSESDASPYWKKFHDRGLIKLVTRATALRTEEGKALYRRITAAENTDTEPEKVEENTIEYFTDSIGLHSSQPIFDVSHSSGSDTISNRSPSPQPQTKPDSPATNDPVVPKEDASWWDILAWSRKHYWPNYLAIGLVGIVIVVGVITSIVRDWRWALLGIPAVILCLPLLRVVQDAVGDKHPGPVRRHAPDVLYVIIFLALIALLIIGFMAAVKHLL